MLNLNKACSLGAWQLALYASLETYVPCSVQEGSASLPVQQMLHQLDGKAKAAAATPQNGDFVRCFQSQQLPGRRLLSWLQVTSFWLARPCCCTLCLFAVTTKLQDTTVCASVVEAGWLLIWQLSLQQQKRTNSSLFECAGLQVAGTLGRKLMLGQRKGLTVDRTVMDVNCKVSPTKP